jgi:hypothetical protein
VVLGSVEVDVKLDAPRRAVTLNELRAHRDEILKLGERFGVRVRPLPCER